MSHSAEPGGGAFGCSMTLETGAGAASVVGGMFAVPPLLRMKV